MTTAHQIAALLDSDGTTWRVGDQFLDDIARERGATFETDGHLTRMAFEDGSALVCCADYWDLEGSEPFSFAGAE